MRLLINHPHGEWSRSPEQEDPLSYETIAAVLAVASAVTAVLRAAGKL